MMVTGPSLRRATFILAPKTPVSTWAPRSRRAETTAPTRGSATGPGAAADQDGRRPLATFAYRVNWLITSSGAPTSEQDFSPSRIRSPHSLAASFAARSGVSSWVTPTRTSSPGSSMAPTVRPSTVTLARLTRCTTARIRRQATRRRLVAGTGQTTSVTIIPEHNDVNPVVAEVIRSGFAESRHRGAVAAVAADGRPVINLGRTDVPFLPRSANKPLQATAMLRCGLNLDAELLALAAASHSGEDFHVDGVRKILSGAGLREDDLRCPPSWPLDIETARRLVARGQGMSRIRMNCSGKHAAMLATCVTNGWPTDGYLAQDHPLQRVIRLVVAELAGEESPVTGIDGCGAPLFALTLTGLARAFRALVLAPDGSPERRVADAMRAYPEWTSGTNRDERRLMDAVPGLLVKGGAEGVDAFALADGRAGAIKIDDGAARARTPVTVAVLRALGAAVPDELATVPVIGGESTVGAIR